MKSSIRLQNIPEYIHARLAVEVKNVEQKTQKKVLNFGQGSPDVRPSQKYLEKLHEYMDAPSSHVYPGYKAIPIFADAIKQWYKTRFNALIETSEILPLLGSKDGIAHFPLAFLDEGDEILVPDPGYPSYFDSAMLMGVTPVTYDLQGDFKLNLEYVKKKLTSRTKTIWINFPSNPTGQIATLEELGQFVKFARENNILLLYDNAYSEITFDNFAAPSIFQINGAKDVAMEFCSFSKSHSFAGLRMGFVTGSKENIATLAKAKTQIDSGMSLPLQQLGAYALLNEDIEWKKKMLESYSSRRDIIIKKLSSLGLSFSVPQAALYIWAKIPEKEKNSEDYCMRLLEEKQILFTPGTAFGKNGERFVRVSICVNIDKIDNYF